MSATYEREIKGILSGDAKVLSSVQATLSPQEQAAYQSATGRPFLMVRAAGSLGADLVALRHDLSFLVEVKSSKQSKIYFSDSARLVDQINEIRTQCERTGVLPLYAFRRKSVRGDAWRLFTLPGMKLTGSAANLARLVPTIEKTEKGNDIIAWDRGIPLARFLEHVCMNGSVKTMTTVAAPAPG